MWALDNRTSFAAERAFVRDVEGREVWIVAVKGTFAIRDDGTTDREIEQAPVCLAPEWFGKPGESSLRYESDLVAGKPGTDVLVHATAYAPNGRAVPSIDVALRVGDRTKNLRVHGERRWRVEFAGARASAPEPFTKMPIVYERTFGPDDRNPVGMGAIDSEAHAAGVRLPNVESPNAPISRWSDRPAPTGFGPIARHWLPRRVLGGTYDSKWSDERKPLLPRDFDPRFHLCAPEDQQFIPHLRGGEPVALLNLTPSGAMTFALPKVALVFRTWIEGHVVEHRATLHTVIVEPDAKRVMMVWGTQLECDRREHLLERTVALEKRYLR